MSLRRRALRGTRSVPAGRTLPLLAVPSSLGRRGVHAGSCETPRFHADLRKRPPALVPARKRLGQGLLLGVRLEPLRRVMAGGARGFDPPGERRRRSWGPPAVLHLRRV